MTSHTMTLNTPAHTEPGSLKNIFGKVAAVASTAATVAFYGLGYAIYAAAGAATAPWLAAAGALTLAFAAGAAAIKLGHDAHEERWDYRRSSGSYSGDDYSSSNNFFLFSMLNSNNSSSSSSSSWSSGNSSSDNDGAAGALLIGGLALAAGASAYVSYKALRANFGN